MDQGMDMRLDILQVEQDYPKGVEYRSQPSIWLFWAPGPENA